MLKAGIQEIIMSLYLLFRSIITDSAAAMFQKLKRESFSAHQETRTHANTMNSNRRGLCRVGCSMSSSQDIFTYTLIVKAVYEFSMQANSYSCGFLFVTSKWGFLLVLADRELRLDLISMSSSHSRMYLWIVLSRRNKLIQIFLSFWLFLDILSARTGIAKLRHSHNSDHHVGLPVFSQFHFVHGHRAISTIASKISFAKLHASFIDLRQQLQSAPESPCGQQAERAMLNMAAHRRLCQVPSYPDLGSFYIKSYGALLAKDTYHTKCQVGHHELRSLIWTAQDKMAQTLRERPLKS